MQTSFLVLEMKEYPFTEQVFPNQQQKEPGQLGQGEKKNKCIPNFWRVLIKSLFNEQILFVRFININANLFL